MLIFVFGLIDVGTRRGVFMISSTRDFNGIDQESRVLGIPTDKHISS